MWKTRFIALALLLISAAPTTAPAPTYMGREIAQTMHYSGADWLTRESREREEDCRAMLKQLELKPGQTVVDFGCGNGFYSTKLAEIVRPEGKVLAVDIQPEMLELLHKRCTEAQIGNIDPILCTEDNPKLPDNCADLILMVDVYHELTKPAEVLAGLKKCLKPGGRIALVEFRAEDPKVPIKPLHKMSREQILKEWNANGLELVREFEGLPWQHLMFFKLSEENRPDVHAATKPSGS